MQDGVLTDYTGSDAVLEEGKKDLCIFVTNELPAASALLHLSESSMKEIESGDVSKLESHDRFDFITLIIPGDLPEKAASQQVCHYMAEHILAFFTIRYAC
jgi:hypothetical protein